MREMSSTTQMKITIQLDGDKVRAASTYCGDAAIHSWAESLVAQTRAGRFHVASGCDRVHATVDADEVAALEEYLDGADEVTGYTTSEAI